MSVKRAFFSVFQKIMVVCCAMFFGITHAFSANLPSGYTELEYIQSSGTQYINTDIYVDFAKNFKVNGRFYNPDASKRKIILGNYSGSGVLNIELKADPAYFRTYFTASTTVDAASNVAMPVNELVSYNVNYDAVSHKSTTIVNGSSFVADIPASSAVASNPLRFFLDWRNPNTVIANPIGIGKTEIYKDDVLVGDFVPAKNSSGVVGMYDTVGNRFYTNAGTGTFTAGPVVGIRIATTAYNTTQFNPVVTDLNTTIATIRSVVTNTINQTKAIADLQAKKQTRPDEQCPAGKKCLLVEDNNGVPHWYEIIENIYGLPSGYTALEYIQSDGNSWIDTGIKGNMSYKYDIEFQQLDAGQYRNWGAFNQQTYNGGPNMSLTYASGFAVRWTVTGSAEQLVNEMSSLDTNRHHLVIDNGYVTWDGVAKGRSGGHRDNYILSYNLFLGTVNPGGTTPTANAKSKYYSYKVWNGNGDLIQNFVPAKNSSGVVGLYDTVTNTFYTNKGTGTFTAGPVVQ